MTHIKTIFSIFLLLCIAKPADAVSDDLKQWLNKLDESLEKAPMYEAEHEQHINAMKKLLTRHESLNKRFETLHSIYLAYQSYKADSAIVYAYKSLTVAKQMRRKDYEIVAMCNLVYICSGEMDEQAFCRFTHQYARQIIISGDRHFNPEQIQDVEALCL